MAFFIDRKHQGLVGRIEVEPDHILHLGDEVRIARDLEGFDQMRLESVRRPDLWTPPYGRCQPPPPWLRTLQWVAFGGFSLSVMCTTCLIFSGVRGLTRERAGGVLQQPVHPLGHVAAAPAANGEHALAHRRRNRLRRQPSPANSTIRALQTTFCGVFRSRTSRSSRSQSAVLIDIRSIFFIGADSQVRADL